MPGMHFYLSWTAVCMTSLAAAAPPTSANDVNLSNLASSMSAAREQAGPNDQNPPQEHNSFSLRHLEAMWHTSLGTQLDKSSSGREEAFRAILDSQWRLLQDYGVDLYPSASSISSKGEDDGSLRDARKKGVSDKSRPPLRSPFLVCGNRHPDAILALETVVHRTRTQLTYSRGDTACFLAGLRLDEVGAVRQSEGIHVVEPLPQPAKLSRSLHAKLDDHLESPESSAVRNDASSSPINASGDEARKTRMAAGETAEEFAGTVRKSRLDAKKQNTFRHSGDDEQQQKRASTPRKVEFNHGEGLPGDLDVSLTPGTRDEEIANTWMRHLTSFESTAHIWDEHLRERFLWTRRSAVKEVGVVEESTVGGDNTESEAGGKRRSLRDESLTSEGRSYRGRNALVEAHGLEGVESLWDQITELSSKDGACDFRRLRASSPTEHNTASSDPRDSRDEATLSRRRRQRRDRVSTGRPPQDSTHNRESSGGTQERIVLGGVGSLGATPQDHPHCLLTVLAYLSTLPEVAYVDDLPQVFELNVEAAWITQSGEETSYSIWDQGIDGRTEIITMADSGLDINSCFFSEDDTDDNIECSTYSSPVYDLTKRKIVQYVGFVDCGDTENGHGTHVGGSAVGAISNTSPGEHFGDGSGFGAKLAVFDFGDENGGLVTPSNIQTQMLQPAYDIGARISTNSWGAIRTTYTSLDRQMDDFAYRKPDMVIVIAGGNCGDVISGCMYQGVEIYGAGSMLSPAIAKNVITVGASEASPSAAGLADNIDEVAYFSSQGPTQDDGRIKPDVVAPGYHLFSAAAKPDQGSSCAIGPMAGTSMATPVVAGVAAMIRQYFVQGWYPSGIPTPSDMFNPSNALVKAMVVASGTAMATYDGSAGSTTLGSPPDGIQGFGRVLLDTVLNVGGSVDLYVEDWVDMTHDEVHTYPINMDEVSSAAFEGDMKVTMVWMEPAAYASSVAPVFNDLDLLVVAFDGTSETTFYPNKLTTKDPDNTVEMIVIPSVDSYEWFNVTVTGASVITTSLPYYALVVTGGTSGVYSSTASATRSWFVRWEVDIEGIPVAEAATESFEAGLAEAISFETGGYTDNASSVVVKIARTEGGNDDNDSGSGSGSTVTAEIVVASEADGYAVLTYIISVGEGSSGSTTSTGAGASDGRGFTAALNEALQGRTTDGCICVAVDVSAVGGGYDCTTCEEGGAFSTALSVVTSQQSGGNGFDLLSVDRSSGQSPVSVFGSADTEGNDDDMFWNDFAGGKAIRGIIRSDTYLDMAGVVIAIVALTALGLFFLRRCLPSSAGDAAGKRSSLTASGSRGCGEGVGAEQLLSTEARGGDAKQKNVGRRNRTSEHGARRNDSPEVYTPRATPAP